MHALQSVLLLSLYVQTHPSRPCGSFRWSGHGMPVSNSQENVAALVWDDHRRCRVALTDIRSQGWRAVYRVSDLGTWHTPDCFNLLRDTLHARRWSTEAVTYPTVEAEPPPNDLAGRAPAPTVLFFNELSRVHFYGPHLHKTRGRVHFPDRTQDFQ